MSHSKYQFLKIPLFVAAVYAIACGDPVAPPIAVTVTPATVTVVAGRSQQLTATITNTSNTAVTYTSSVQTVATVSASGLVTGVSAGVSTVTVASVADPTKTATIAVTVTPAVAVAMTPATATGLIGQTVQFTVAVTNTTNTGITCSSSVQTVATVAVNAGGCIATAVGSGNTTISATSQDDVTKTATASLTITPVSITIPATLAVTVGQVANLAVTVTNAVNLGFTCATTSAAIASVVKTATACQVTGVAVGTATVTAKSDADPAKTANTTVTVSPAPTSGQIIGRVVDALSRSGISGASVAVVQGSVTTATLTTSADGSYSTAQIPSGTYSLNITASGYTAATLQNAVVTTGVTSLISVPLVPASSQTGSIAGVARNARTAVGMSGVTIELRQGVNATTGTIVATMTSSSTGAYSFASLPAGTYSVLARITGFVDGLITGISVGGSVVADQDLSLSPAAAAGEYRIVLTWGQNPSDLDSHLTVPTNPRYLVYFGDQGSLTASPFAALDVDETSSFGPETITITQQQTGVYRYSVHHYSGTATISTSGARVQVFRGSTLIGQFEPPAGALGVDDFWHVFELNGTTLTPVNTINKTPDI